MNSDEDMAQKDPLYVPKCSDSVSVQITHENPRGRPALSKSIQFCSQPKSIVSQLLSNTRKNLKNKTSCLNIERDVLLKTLVVNDISVNSNYSESTQRGSRDSIDSEDFSASSPNDTDKNTPKCTKVKCEVKKGFIHCLKSDHKRKLNRVTKSKYSNGHSDRSNEIIKVKHQDSHYSCDHAGCNYKSKQLTNLTKHKRIHSNERPYMCDQCPFRSNYVNSLKVHRRIHTSERPYCCHRCGYRCNSTSNLKKHFLHKHGDNLKDTK